MSFRDRLRSRQRRSADEAHLGVPSAVHAAGRSTGSEPWRNEWRSDGPRASGGRVGGRLSDRLVHFSRNIPAAPSTHRATAESAPPNGPVGADGAAGLQGYSATWDRLAPLRSSGL